MLFIKPYLYLLFFVFFYIPAAPPVSSGVGRDGGIGIGHPARYRFQKDEEKKQYTEKKLLAVEYYSLVGIERYS